MDRKGRKNIGCRCSVDSAQEIRASPLLVCLDGRKALARLGSHRIHILACNRGVWMSIEITQLLSRCSVINYAYSYLGHYRARHVRARRDLPALPSVIMTQSSEAIAYSTCGTLTAKPSVAEDGPSCSSALYLLTVTNQHRRRTPMSPTGGYS